MPRVYLSNRGNPDHRQNPNKPISGTKSDYFVEVADQEEGRSEVAQYIFNNDLGGGNWTGGHYFNDNNEMVGYFSYNARFWDSGPIFTQMKVGFKGK